MTELLVVIGIIILVVGIAMPSLTRAWRTADRTRTAGDLQAIAAALEAYKQDHGDYPRVRAQQGLTHVADRPNPPTGAQILCQALVGPAPATDASSGTNRRKQDGADGPGFRTRGTSGKVYGPYLPPERFKIGNPDRASPYQLPPANSLLVCILDRYDRPILYFPASPTKPNINVMNQPGERPSFVHTDPTPAPDGPYSEKSLYDADDNLSYFQRTTGDPNGIARIRLMLGDLPPNQGGEPRQWSGVPNGVIGANETAATTGPFLLWSSGPDELFGPDAETAPEPTILNHLDAARCDDVTNFRS